ncbi:16534_t:CDS:2, partial [Gigaspora margarita]
NNFTLSYGLTINQSVTGYEGQDTIIFGGVSVAQQTFGLATNTPFSDVEDGIIGFKVDGVMQSIKTHNKLSQNIIGFHLRREKNVSKDLSFMTLGVWIIPLIDAKINRKSVGTVPTAPAIIDTGTTLVYGISSVVDAIHSQIPDAILYSLQQEQIWLISCDTISVVSFPFDNGLYSIDPAELIMNTNKSICISGLQSNHAIFGSSVYSLFGFDSYQFGFTQTRIITNLNSSSNPSNSSHLLILK